MGKTPTSIITGYLGSGKTTLLRNIVNQAEKKLAILMNEFGEISIDSEIIKGKNVDMKELSGGCVCCSLTGEFEEAIKEIVEKVNPDAIIIETTGVAEPDAIAMDMEDQIKEIRLDSIITVVDSDSIIRYPSIGHTARVQIEMADILILNKTDLITNEQLDEVRKTILELNTNAIILPAVKCNINTKLLFSMDIERIKKTIEHKNHKIDIDYFDYISEEQFNEEKIENFLNSLPEDIYRLKGFINIDSDAYLLNYVAGRYELELQNEKKKNELVFIGKDINKIKDVVIKNLGKCRN